MRLTSTQKSAVRTGSARRWKGTRETGVQGSTMEALARRGLAGVRVTKRPYRRLVYLLTPAGVQLRNELVAPEIEQRWAELAQGAPSAGVLCRCEFCGAEFEDATPGGSCGRCGSEVGAVEASS